MHRLSVLLLRLDFSLRVQRVPSPSFFSSLLHLRAGFSALVNPLRLSLAMMKLIGDLFSPSRNHSVDNRTVLPSLSDIILTQS